MNSPILALRRILLIACAAALPLAAGAVTVIVTTPPVVAVSPSMPAIWLATHNIPATVVDWQVERLPTAAGFRVEVVARTSNGFVLATKCENANATDEKPKFSTKLLARVVLDFDQKWFAHGETLSILCTAGGQQHVEQLVGESVTPRAPVAASAPADLPAGAEPN
jgi:hypothetical protein